VDHPERRNWITPSPPPRVRALIRGAEQFRSLAPLLPEVVERLGEFGLWPGELHLTWGSVDWNLGARTVDLGSAPGRARGAGGEQGIGAEGREIAATSPIPPLGLEPHPVDGGLPCERASEPLAMDREASGATKRDLVFVSYSRRMPRG